MASSIHKKISKKGQRTNSYIFHMVTIDLDTSRHLDTIIVSSNVFPVFYTI